MRVFNRLDPKKKSHFYYEMNDIRSRKEGTEDVTNTRDITNVWHDVPGAGCYVAWDCWAEHVKLTPFGKPKIITSESIGEALRGAFDSGKSFEEKLVMVGDDDPFKNPHLPALEMVEPEDAAITHPNPMSVPTVEELERRLAAQKSPELSEGSDGRLTFREYSEYCEKVEKLYPEFMQDKNDREI
jgi:hypothetical protein